MLLSTQDVWAYSDPKSAMRAVGTAQASGANASRLPKCLRIEDDPERYESGNEVRDHIKLLPSDPDDPLPLH